jgi:hypothetical protein
LYNSFCQKDTLKTIQKKILKKLSWDCMFIDRKLDYWDTDYKEGLFDKVYYFFSFFFFSILMKRYLLLLSIL